MTAAPAAQDAIQVGDREFRLDSIEFIDMQSAHRAEVRLRDGHSTRLSGAEASALSLLLSRGLPPGAGAKRFSKRLRYTR
jgi:hypothetical protein